MDRRARDEVPAMWPTPPARAGRRYGIAGAFAVVVAACAVWVQTGATPGAADRPGSGPLAALGAGPTGAPSPSLASVHEWVVQPGDTVWAIARRVQPGGDIRPLVDELSGELHGATLQVGQRLIIP